MFNDPFVLIFGAFGVLLAIVLGVVLFIALRDIFGMAKTGSMHDRVLKNGEAAQAVILKVWETGAAIGSVNPSPELGLTVQVQPANGPAYQAETSTFIKVWDVPQVQPGSVIQVKFDPKNPTQVAVVSV